MRKILHIITGLNDGGAEAVLFRLCEHDKKNIHIVVSLMDEGKYGLLIEKSGINVHYLNMPPGRIRFLSLIKLFKLIRETKPDVVQTWMYHADLIGGVIARLAGVRNVVWGVHHSNLIKGQSKSSTILIAKINAVLSYFVPRHIIYCAKKSRQVQEGFGFNKNIGKVVSNGYNVIDFTINQLSGEIFRKELELASECFLIGNVGRYHPLKDYKTFSEAINLLDNHDEKIKVAIVGTGLTAKNEELALLFNKSNGVEHTKFLGRRNDIPSIMNGFDLFVLTSTSEAFPNVLNEAMACGTPCVTTDVGDAAFIVGDTGWVVPSKNPGAIASAILIAISEWKNNPQAWHKRKQACRQRIVENFSVEKMVSKYNEVWFCCK